jgi:hypothetical protein
LYQFIRRVIQLTVVIIVGYHCYEFIQTFIEYPSLKIKFIYRRNYVGTLMWFSNRSATDEIFLVRQILEKNGSIMRTYISYS